MDSTIKVSRGGSFELSFGGKHYPKLAVVRPDGHWLFLVDKSVSKGLMSEEQFTGATLVHIDTETLVATDFVNGKPVEVKVFATPGRYEFVSSDNLETERENMSEVSQVVTYE